jgi:hypothetical protein
MGAKPRVNVDRRPTGGGISYSREFLERLVRILVHSGHSPKQLAREFRDICARLKEPARRWDPTRLAYVADLTHVIAHWYADPQYLDSRGAPLPLPLRGRGPSLCALIERVLPEENAVAVAQSLCRVQGVRRRAGRYVPSGRCIVFPQTSGRFHGLAALLGMLRTVEHNVAGVKTSAILERTAINPSFPVSALPAFHRRLKAQATDFLWNVDGDMRRRENGAAGGARTRLGVGVFAFEEPLAPDRGARKPRATPGAPRSRGGSRQRRA